MTEEHKFNEEHQSHDEPKSHEEHKSNGEPHHVEHKTHSEHEPKGKKVKKATFWKSISAVLGILLVISLYFNFSDGPSADTISIDKAADMAVNYINDNLLQPGTTATLEGKSDEGNLYNLKMNIGGQEYDSYVTKDGKLLFPSSVDLTAQPTQPAQPAEAAPTVPIDMETLMDDDEVKGDANAPVTIIEWSDFECPFCARFYDQTYGQIVKEYIETGKVKIIFRDFPLGFHANAQKAAESAECAGEQGKYYEMHDKLFEEGVTGGVDSFKQYAKDLNLDTTKFNECLDSGTMADEIAKDMQDGQSVGISGTPGFIINGQLLSGAQPFAAFKQVIDAELAK